MTVKELYEKAVENGWENETLSIHCFDNDGCPFLCNPDEKELIKKDGYLMIDLIGDCKWMY